jgi:hypothetical protein
MKPFEVEVDASNYAIGAVLMQKDDKVNNASSGLFLKNHE